MRVGRIPYEHLLLVSRIAAHSEAPTTEAAWIRGLLSRGDGVGTTLHRGGELLPDLT